MNVLHIDEQRGWRGGEQQACYLVQRLTRRGHKCIIVGRPGTPFLEYDYGIPGLTRLSLPFRGELDPVSAWRIARAVRRHGIDIIHAHTSHAHTVACLAGTLAGRAKVVVSRRVDFAPRDNLLSRWKYTRPHRIVAVSRKIMAVLSEFGVSPDRISVVHSGIDPARLDTPAVGRGKLGIDPEAWLLLSTAALVGHKDHATLLTAMPQVLRKRPETHLLIAGEGPLRTKLEQQATDLGLGHSVRFLGYRRDVPGLLRAADAFVLSSSEEGLGTAVLDAMCCGLPVVTTAAGGIPEMVRDGVNGLLVPPGDPGALARALVAVQEDKALACRLGKAARETVLSEFTSERMIDGNIDVYRSVLAGHAQ